MKTRKNLGGISMFIIDTIIKCIKEGIEAVITFNEYLENRKTGRIKSAKQQISTYYEIVDIKSKKGVFIWREIVEIFFYIFQNSCIVLEP